MSCTQSLWLWLGWREDAENGVDAMHLKDAEAIGNIRATLSDRFVLFSLVVVVA